MAVAIEWGGGGQTAKGWSLEHPPHILSTTIYHHHHTTTIAAGAHWMIPPGIAGPSTSLFTGLSHT